MRARRAGRRRAAVPPARRQSVARRGLPGRRPGPDRRRAGPEAEPHPARPRRPHAAAGRERRLGLRRRRRSGAGRELRRRCRRQAASGREHAGQRRQQLPRAPDRSRRDDPPAGRLRGVEHAGELHQLHRRGRRRRRRPCARRVVQRHRLPRASRRRHGVRGRHLQQPHSEHRARRHDLHVGRHRGAAELQRRVRPCRPDAARVAERDLARRADPGQRPRQQPRAPHRRERDPADPASDLGPGRAGAGLRIHCGRRRRDRDGDRHGAVPNRARPAPVCRQRQRRRRAAHSVRARRRGRQRAGGAGPGATRAGRPARGFGHRRDAPAVGRGRDART